MNYPGIGCLRLTRGLVYLYRRGLELAPVFTVLPNDWMGNIVANWQRELSSSNNPHDYQARVAELADALDSGSSE
jgi:hypothetical protein